MAEWEGKRRREGAKGREGGKKGGGGREKERSRKPFEMSDKGAVM